MPGGHRARPIGRLACLSVAGRVALAATAFLVLAWPGQAAARNTPNPIAEAPPQPATWSMDLFDAAGFRFQNPDLNGCAAAATISMLNMIASTPQPDQPPPRGGSLPAYSFRWTHSTTWNAQETIMWYERSHMSMSRDTKGSDPHGWRNGLNYFGWGSLNADVYRDISYKTFTAATHAVVNSVARTGKPAGVLGWAGSHAQYVTGYTVKGNDPRVSDNYTIVGVFLSDPLREENRPTVYLTLEDWKSGGYPIEFAKYRELGSYLSDPIDHQIGDKEWYGKWVVVQPVR
jgi:hypothetical protein